jgi:hypothetical protein
MGGMSCALEPGAPATFCVLETAEDNQILSVKTYVQGEATAG